MPAARSAPDQGVRSGLEVVEVVAQAGDVDQAVDRQLGEPAEKPEVFDADDDRVKRLADALLEVSQELDSDQIALGGLGPALGAGAVLAQGATARRGGSGASCPRARRSTGDGPAGRDSGGSAR